MPISIRRRLKRDISVEVVFRTQRTFVQCSCQARYVRARARSVVFDCVKSGEDIAGNRVRDSLPDPGYAD